MHAGTDSQDYQATGMLQRDGLPGPATVPI